MKRIEINPRTFAERRIQIDKPLPRVTGSVGPSGDHVRFRALSVTFDGEVYQIQPFTDRRLVSNEVLGRAYLKIQGKVLVIPPSLSRNCIGVIGLPKSGRVVEFLR